MLVEWYRLNPVNFSKYEFLRFFLEHFKAFSDFLENLSKFKSHLLKISKLLG